MLSIVLKCWFRETYIWYYKIPRFVVWEATAQSAASRALHLKVVSSNPKTDGFFFSSSSSSSSWVWFSDSHWLSFTYWKTEKQPKNKSDVKWAQWTWQDLFCDYKLTWFVIDAWFLIIILVWSMAVFTPPPRPASRLIFSLNAPFFNHFTKCRKCLVYFFPRSVLLSLLWQCHDSDIWYPRARYQIKTLLSASV